MKSIIQITDLIGQVAKLADQTCRRLFFFFLNPNHTFELPVAYAISRPIKSIGLYQDNLHTI